MRDILLTMMLLSLATGAVAQDALLKAQERAKYLSDYRAMLEHADGAVRLAAVEEALASDDPQLRSMALETAFGGDDERIQTTALRWYFNARSQIPVTLMLPERPSEAQKSVYQKWGGLILKNVQVSPTDEIVYRAPYAKGGQLIRGGMELRFNAGAAGVCTMTARPAGGTVLAGQFNCSFGPAVARRLGAEEAALPVRIDIS